MAFLSGTAADTLDLMGQVSTFLQGQGYVLMHSKTISNNGSGTYQTNEVCLHHNSGDDEEFYISLMTTNTNMETPMWGEKQNNYHMNFNDDARYAGDDKERNVNGSSQADADPYLGATMHLDYNAGSVWHNQNNAKKVYSRWDIPSPPNSYNCYSAMAGANGQFTFWVFLNENPHCVHIVAEYQLGYYSHMTFGALAKSHTYVGGQYVVGSARPLIGDHPYDGYIMGGLDSGGATVQDWTRAFSYAVYCRGDGDNYYVGDDQAAINGWGRVTNPTGIAVPRYSNENILSSEMYSVGATGDTYEGYMQSLRARQQHIPCALGYMAAITHPDYDGAGTNHLASTYDMTTGQAAPIPLTAWCDHKGDGEVYLGSYVHVGVIMMSVYSGKEEFTLGGNTYQVFPMSALLAGSDDHTPVQNKGMDNVRKEASLYKLGLAIRKVV